jgi:hypothetical protein
MIVITQREERKSGRHLPFTGLSLARDRDGQKELLKDKPREGYFHFLLLMKEETGRERGRVILEESNYYLLKCI